MTHHLICIEVHRVVRLLIQLRHVALVMKVGVRIASTVFALASHPPTISLTGNSLSF